MGNLSADEAKNVELWESVCVTDPIAVKPITGKPYKGNSPKPYWLIRRATETFGACGQGWGVEVKSESFFRMTETDVMHTAVVRVWYMRDGKRCEIEQMGQTKACYKTNSGSMMVDEDAGKKSVTDGMTKCLSMIGFAGDIFSGRWDDSSYVQWASDQFKVPEPEPIDILPMLQAAALNGVDALKAARIENNATADHPVWVANKDTLLTVAKKADSAKN